MASDYPGAIDSFRTIANVPGETFDASKTTRLYAEDVEYLEEDIIAIETTLGINPQGIYATVKAWLEALVSALSGKQDSLGFTPENVANKDTTTTLGTSDTKYPSQKAVKTYVDTGLATKQDSLGFTPENVANKDTDGTLAANSDTKYPSQKATKTYVDTTSASKVSDTAYGSSWNGVTDVAPSKNAVYDEIETLSGTIPSVNITTSLIPHPAGAQFINNGTIVVSGNTKMRVGRFIVPVKMTAAKVTIRTANHTTNGTYKLALYSEDGQTKLFEVTTATTSDNTNISTTFTGVVLNPGIYYFAILAQSTASVDIANWSSSGAVSSAFEHIASEPVYTGFLTVTANTIPSTITPTSITYEDNDCMLFRLDN